MKTRLSYGRNAHALCVLMLACTLAACSSTPEEKSAKFIAEGKRMLLQKDPTRAVLQFRNAVQLTPNSAEALYQLALAYLETGDAASGVKALRKALDLDPKHRGAELRMAELMAASDDKGLLEDAQARLQAFLQDAPEDPNALHAMALTEWKLGEQGDAMQTLQRALAAAPNELRIAVTLAQAKLQKQDVKGAEEVLRKFVEGSPKSSEAQTIIAYFYIAQKRNQEAEQHLRGALSLDPKSGSALLTLARLQLAGGRKQEAEQNLKQLAALRGYESIYGMFLSHEGRNEEALRELEKVAKESPESREARTNLLAGLQRANRVGDAKKILDATLKSNPKDLDALLQRAEFAINDRDFARAEADLGQVLKLKPDAPEGHYVKARLNQAAGNMRMYREELAKTLELNPYLLPVRLEAARNLAVSSNPRAAIDVLRAAPEGQASSIGVVVERNWAYWALGDLAAMRKGIDQGLAQEKTQELLVQDGMWKLRSGQPAQAREALLAALQLNTQDIRALAGLRQSYAELNQAAVGVQKVKEYAATQTNSAPIQDYLGVILILDKDLAGARKAFMAALAADPKFEKAEMGLVQINMLEGNRQEARARVDKMLASGSTDPTLQAWKGNLDLMAGNHQAAIEQFRKVIQVQPENSEVLNNLAFLLAEHANNLDEAIDYAQKAVELAPQNPNYADTLGWILYRKQLYRPAIQHLERAGSARGNALWKYHLAMGYAKIGDQDKGKAMLAQALKLDASLPEAKEAQELIGASH